MPLVQIVGSTATNHTFYIGGAFIQRENKATFAWLFEGVKDILYRRRIPLPRVIITDRDIAQINALKEVLPTARRILCLWHINKAIEAQFKRCFKDLISGPDLEQGRQMLNEEWDTFNTLWRTVYRASEPTTAFFAWARLQATYENNPYIGPMCRYLRIQWYPFKEAFFYCYTKQYLHFGNSVTSRLEGMHSVLKKALGGCQNDLPGVIQRLEGLLEAQEHKIKARISREKMLRWPQFPGYLWSTIQGKVSQFALQTVLDECHALKLDVGSPGAPEGLFRPHEWLLGHARPCSGAWQTSWGLPCPHSIARLILHGGQLQMEHFNIHWALNQRCRSGQVGSYSGSWHKTLILNE